MQGAAMSTTPAEFDADLLDPIYEEWGVALRIIPRTGQPVDVIALDKTAGTVIREPGQFALDTVKPAFVVRLAELAAQRLDVAAIADGQAVAGHGTAAARTWRISAPREQRGEVFLVLLEE
jgi:hypothetical protein